MLRGGFAAVVFVAAVVVVAVAVAVAVDVDVVVVVIAGAFGHCCGQGVEVRGISSLGSGVLLEASFGTSFVGSLLRLNSSRSWLSELVKGNGGVKGAWKRKEAFGGTGMSLGGLAPGDSKNGGV